MDYESGKSAMDERVKENSTLSLFLHPLEFIASSRKMQGYLNHLNICLNKVKYYVVEINYENSG